MCMLGWNGRPSLRSSKTVERETGALKEKHEKKQGLCVGGPPGSSLYLIFLNKRGDDES
jgi:hypothetical protein